MDKIITHEHFILFFGDLNYECVQIYTTPISSQSERENGIMNDYSTVSTLLKMSYKGTEGIGEIQLLI